MRVLLVKLADRLHNMRTLQFMPPDKRRRIAEETLDIYAPLAGRMGIQEMREELEDLSFQNLNPEAYETISRHLREVTAKSEKLVDEIERDSDRQADGAGASTAKVTGRQKRPYSIWRKMERKSVSFEQLSDIFGFRVIVDTVDDCYRALGVVHTTWPMVPGRYKDYISTPKQNDYRSIHTTVIGPGRQRVELQIRTAAMDEVAEYGIAAHALYKEGVNDNSRPRRREPRLSMAAPHRRPPRRGRQPGGVPRAHQARTVPRPGLLLHAEGPAHRPAARRDADRFRLRGAHRCRQHGGRAARSTAAWRRS